MKEENLVGEDYVKSEDEKKRRLWIRLGLDHENKGIGYANGYRYVLDSEIKKKRRLKVSPRIFLEFFEKLKGNQTWVF
jgi:hypothetical protein